MPSSSAAVGGEFHPTPFRSHKTKSGQSLESTRPVTPQQIQTNLSTIDEIPSNAKKVIRGGFASSKGAKFGLAAIITGLVATSIAVPLVLVLPKSNQNSSSSVQSTISTILTTITTQTTTTATSTTSLTTTSITSVTTSTSTTSKTTSTSTSTSTTTSTTSTSTTSTTSTTSSTTTTTGVIDSPSLWTFDNNTLDSLSIFNGVTVNSPTYVSPGINGYGCAMSFLQANSQYVTVSTYRNLYARSFTIEMWFYATSLSTSDFGLFGQYYVSTTDESLHIQIRNYNIDFAFWSDDCYGASTIQLNVWYHLALVFDYSALMQRIYLNGILDGSRSSSYFQGQNGSIVIGKTEQIVGVPNYFNGYIDQVSLVMRAKNVSEVLNDATLVTYHSFDGGSYVDSGSLSLPATVSNITSVAGRVNQAISFNSSASYYQVYGFVLLGVSSDPYSVALWAFPSSITGSILVRLSTTTNGNGWCVDLMGFSSTGQIIVTAWGSPASAQVVGPIAPANAWTHIVATYSTANALRLYVNGTYYAASTAVTYGASGRVNILTLGNPLQGIQFSAGGPCNSQSIVPGAYYGYIDEFRVYSRELNASDVYTLANP